MIKCSDFTCWRETDSSFSAREKAKALTEQFIVKGPGDDDWRRRLFESF